VVPRVASISRIVLFCEAPDYNFLLETRLQSESFDTLDDLLGFRVQKL